MIIDISPLLSGKQNKLDFDLEGQIEDEILQDQICFTAPVRVNGEITNQAGYMEIVMDVGYSYEVACDRCSLPIVREGSLRIEKGIASVHQVDEEENDRYLLYDGTALVLDTAIADQIYLSLPYRNLCREDCRGYCTGCGTNLNEGQCSCQKKTVDPRLAVLQKLLEDQNE